MSMVVSEWYKLPYGAVISVKEGAKVDAGAVVAAWDPHTHPIIADRAGVVRYQAFEDGITVKRQVDELTGLANFEIIDEKDRPAAGKDLKPVSSSTPRVLPLLMNQSLTFCCQVVHLCLLKMVRTSKRVQL